MKLIYGKIGPDLLCNLGTSPDLEKYELVWIITNSNVEPIISMLITAALSGVAIWRIEQIYKFYDIQDSELIKAVKEYFDVKVQYHGNYYHLSTPSRRNNFVISSDRDHLLFGVIDILFQAGYKVSPTDPRPKV